MDCKHVYAVRFVMEREQRADGRVTVTKSVTVTETVKRTYPQNWPAYLEHPALTPILRDLIAQSSLPLKGVEIDFAADSSGVTTNKFHRWFDHKYGQERQEHDWVKVHIMCGVKTNIVTAIEIHGRNASDAHQLPAQQDVRLLHVSARGVSRALPQAQQRRDDVLDDQA